MFCFANRHKISSYFYCHSVHFIFYCEQMLKIGKEKQHSNAWYGVGYRAGEALYLNGNGVHVC